MKKVDFKASSAASAASVILISFLMLLGVKGRVFSHEGVVVSRNPLSAHKALMERGGRGRLVICITRHSHSTPLDDMKLIGYRTFPVRPIPLISRYKDLLNEENLLWVIMQEGVARKIIYVVPEEEWGRISSMVTQRIKAPPLEMDFRGSPIFIYTMDALPEIREKAVLFIDSSVSSTMEPESLMKFLKVKRIDYDLALLTVSAAGGQERVLQLASLLREPRD